MSAFLTMAGARADDVDKADAGKATQQADAGGVDGRSYNDTASEPTQQVEALFATGASNRLEPLTDDISLNRSLAGDKVNSVSFPQLSSVHLQMWVARRSGTVDQCIQEFRASFEGPLVDLRQKLQAVVDALGSALVGQSLALPTRQLKDAQASFKKVREVDGDDDPLLQELFTTPSDGPHPVTQVELGRLLVSAVRARDVVNARLQEEQIRNRTGGEDGTGIVRTNVRTDQGIINRIYDFAALGKDRGTAAGPISLPALQYDIYYCFRVEGRDIHQTVDDRVDHRGYFIARVAWPLSASKTWWKDRYVSASVGVGFSGWKSWTKTEFDSTASPYLFVGALVNPWPTDRRFSYSERVHGNWWQHVDVLVAAALMNPWPNANVPKSLGASGLVLGTGMTFGDNILGVSAGAVIGRADYTDHDALGIAHDRTATLVAPTLMISTQADVVAAINSLVGGSF